MWYLAELLLGLPDANHLRGVGDDGGRRPSGHVVRMAVFVLWRRARRSNHEAGNKKPSHAAKTRRSRDCTAPSSSGCEPGTGSWTWRCPPWPSSWPSCWAGRPGGGQSETSSGGGGEGVTTRRRDDIYANGRLKDKQEAAACDASRMQRQAQQQEVEPRGLFTAVIVLLEKCPSKITQLKRSLLLARWNTFWKVVARQPGIRFI